MRTVNSVTLLGNIAREPDMRVTSSGKEFATFVIATHRETLKNGERSTIPDFHNLVAWGNLAQIAKNFCNKGRLVYIEGHLKTRSWEGDNGEKVFRTEVIATNIIALSPSDSFTESHNDSGGNIENINTEDFFNASEDDFFSDSK